MIPILINKDEYEIIFTVGVEKMVYKTDINSFVAETGMTVNNVSFPIKGIYINLSEIGKNFVCGNIMENLFLKLKRNGIEDELLIVDFNDIEELSESFYQSYTKVLLETSNKIITINMNTRLSNEFASFIKKSIIQKTEEDEEWIM